MGRLHAARRVPMLVLAQAILAGAGCAARATATVPVVTPDGVRFVRSLSALCLAGEGPKPSLDFGDQTYEPPPLESPEQLIRLFDDGVARVRGALADLPDPAWSETWKLAFKGQPLFEGTRFLAYREMFLNHLVHHRAQLGTYLRLNDVPLPPTYGPSADDRLGL